MATIVRLLAGGVFGAILFCAILGLLVLTDAAIVLIRYRLLKGKRS